MGVTAMVVNNEMNQEKTFLKAGPCTIAMSEGQNPVSIVKLLIWVAKQLRESEQAKAPIHLSSLYLQHPSTMGEIPELHFDFWYRGKRDLKFTNENKEWNKEYKVSPEVEEISYLIDPPTPTTLNRFTQRLPQGETQDDGILLLEEVAKTIEALGKIEVLDLTYHDYTDKDAIGHPFINVYFRNK